MTYIYKEHPTLREIIARANNVKEAEKTWEKLTSSWYAKSEKLPLKSKDDHQFWFVVDHYLLKHITRIAQHRGFLEAVTLPPKTRQTIEERALNLEAYYSSHIEGAISSLENALRFIKGKQKYSPDESLQMIKNNQIALQYILKQIGKPITKNLICKLQHILTENTHRDRPIVRGEYRPGPVYIVDSTGQVVYEGPPHNKVPEMMVDFIRWINEEENMEPVIKAGITHLYFVHVHPFQDGNGRTARALSNLVLANAGLKFINMLSLSDYFDHRRPKYYKAIQDVGMHNYDLTYFLIFYLEALTTKLEEIKKEIELKTRIENLRNLIPEDTYHKLHRRHIKTLRFMLKNREKITTKKYCKLNKCSDEAARKDFLALINLGLIKPIGQGRSRSYVLKN